MHYTVAEKQRPKLGGKNSNHCYLGKGLEKKERRHFWEKKKKSKTAYQGNEN